MGLLNNKYLKTFFPFISLISVLTFLASSTMSQNSATLILYNGKIATLDKNNSFAQAVAIEGNRILAVGKNEEIKKLADVSTRLIDLKGNLVLPGFNDAHLHFLNGGMSLLQLNLNGCKSSDQIKAKIIEKQKFFSPGAWVKGRGWDHTLFNQGKWPDKEFLDRILPDNPALLMRIDGHVAWVNSKALKLAGIDKNTPDPVGGEIVKDENNGEPTGILKEKAVDLVANIIPEPAYEEKKKAVLLALEEAKKYGVTSVQDNSEPDVINIYKELLQEGKLTCRISFWFPLDMIKEPKSLSEYKKKFPADNDFLRFGLLKGFADGTVGSRTAWLFEPYSDLPGDTGIIHQKTDELYQMMKQADSLGYQLGIHCIGDKANSVVLNYFEKIQKENGNRNTRHRIEHAQVLKLEDVVLFSRSNVVASMQPTHCTTDKRWAEQRLGKERCRGAYTWKSILNSGGHLAFGTDWAVEPLNPMEGIYSAVTRQSREDGSPAGGWFPEERISMTEALRCYTRESAYAEFQEVKKGSLEVSKLADLIVLDKDLFTIPEQEILKTKVLMTVVDGRIVYQDKDFK